MNHNKGLIGGTDQSEERIYPPNWLCVNCNHSLSAHRNVFVDFPFNFESVLECRECGKAYFKDMKFCNSYKPVDNLTYVERKANERLST